MATVATFFRRTEIAALERAAVRAGADPWELRELPNEDVFFYSKRIDNSRVVRQADPKARSECWTAIGAACLAAALLTSALVPSVGRVLAGYQVQALEAEYQLLSDERRVLEVGEAALRSPARLEQLARERRLVQPANGQIVHLEGDSDASLALNLKSARTQ
jgi:hypothetical protein